MRISLMVVLVSLSLGRAARADEPAADAGPEAADAGLEVATPDAGAAPAPELVTALTGAKLVLGGYTEAFFQWNVNDPSNGITNFRGFDNRHNSFTVANAVIDAAGTLGGASAHVAIQFGHTPETYYLAEPISRGAAGAASTNASVWKFLQQANAGFHVPIGNGIFAEAGIFLSPIGPEGLAIKDQWNWSRSNLFFGLPFYHTGVRLSYPFTDRLTVMFMACNGWNSVVDNNPENSFALEAAYAITDKLASHVLYFTGVERPVGAPEGRAWRHLFDAYLTYSPVPWFSFNVHADAGFEPNTFGLSHWEASALSVRVNPVPWLFIAARGDVFFEKVASNAQGTAASIFWPAPWVSSQTLTFDFRPHPNASFRLEYRHDQAGTPMYFKGAVATNAAGDWVTNAASQDTFTAGLTAWF